MYRLPPSAHTTRTVAQAFGTQPPPGVDSVVCSASKTISASGVSASVTVSPLLRSRCGREKEMPLSGWRGSSICATVRPC